MPLNRTVRYAAQIPLAFAVSLLLLSCGDDGGTTTEPDPPRATSVVLDATSLSFEALGDTHQLAATVRDQTGAVMATEPVTWRSTEGTVASVSSAGLVSSVGNGIAIIVATAGSVADSAVVAVDQVADAVEITGGNVILSGPGQSTSLTASVKDKNGHDVTSQGVVWSTSDLAVATFGGNTVSAISYGSALITATWGSIADTVGLSVAKVISGDAVAVTSLPVDGKISLYLSGAQDLHIDLSALGGDGGPLQGGNVGFGGLDPMYLVVDGPHGGVSDFIPTFLSGSSTFLFDISSPESPLASVTNEAGVQIASVTTTTITESEATQAGSKVGDGIFRADGSRWEWRVSDRWCMTYEEVAERYQSHWVSWGPGSYAGLTVGDGGGVNTPVTFFLQGGVLGNVSRETMGSELARVASESLGLTTVLSGTDRSQVRVESGGESALTPANPLSSDGYISIQSDPTDLYCSGGVPEAMTVDLPFSVGGVGTDLEVEVLVTSHWGNGVSGVPVTFSVNSAHGSLNGTGQQIVQTDSDGLAEVSWTLPGEAGTYQLTASASGPDGPLSGSPTTVSAQATTSSIPTGVIRSTLTTGSRHTCGLTPSGEAFCWGANESGQIGDGSTSDRRTPKAVSGGLFFSEITAGSAHTCGLTSGGEVYCWGGNNRGVLGDGTAEDSPVPVRVFGETLFSRINAGSNHTCALTASGEAYCWGENFSGKLGDGTDTDRNRPRPVLGGHQFSELSAGGQHTCGVTTGGEAICWGHNNHGQLGDGGRIKSFTPVMVVGTYEFLHVAAGHDHTCAVTSGGEALCWGNNDLGQLGTGIEGLFEASVPTEVTGDLEFAQISAFHRHTCGFNTNGEAYCWGDGGGGRLGNGLAGGSLDAPSKVTGGLIVHQIRAGGNHSCALIGTGEAYCWGTGDLGQIGVGGSTGSTVPLAVSGGIIWASGG